MLAVNERRRTTGGAFWAAVKEPLVFAATFLRAPLALRTPYHVDIAFIAERVFGFTRFAQPALQCCWLEVRVGDPFVLAFFPCEGNAALRIFFCVLLWGRHASSNQRAT